MDEDDFPEDMRRRVRDLLCATAESLALATKSELEIESKLNSEDNAALETAVSPQHENGTVAEAVTATAGEK